MIDMEELLEDMKQGLIICVAGTDKELIDGAEELLLEMSHTNIKTGNGMSVFDYVQYYRKLGWTHIVYKDVLDILMDGKIEYHISMVRKGYEFKDVTKFTTYMDAKDVLEIYAYTGMKEELDTKDLSILFEV